MSQKIKVRFCGNCKRNARTMLLFTKVQEDTSNIIGKWRALLILLVSEIIQDKNKKNEL